MNSIFFPLKFILLGLSNEKKILNKHYYMRRMVKQKNLSGLDLRKHKRDIDDCTLLGSLSTHLLSAPIYDQLL